MSFPIESNGKKNAENVLQQEHDRSSFPEGTLYGWLSVLGGFSLSVATFGYIVSWATFQAYYEETLLVTSTSSQIAWIGSLQYSLSFFPGLFTGRLFDAGYFRACLLCSSVLYIAASFLIAECTQYWEFLLCQGLAIGLGNGMIYVPCVGLVSQWFKIKRPIAFSIISLGSAVGGIIYPVMFRSLIERAGFPWTMRAMAFLNATMFVIANLTMFTRFPPKTQSDSWLDLSIFKSKPYSVYVLCTFTAFLGIYTVLTFLGVRALTIGFSQNLAFNLIAISNALSAVGRLAGGLYAYKFGAINAMIVFTFVAAIFSYIWPYVTNHAGFIVVICIYGISSGAFVALFPLGVVSLGDISNLGKRAGMQMTVMSFGALAGPPISGAILHSTNENFKLVGIFAGSVIALSVIMMLLSRFFALNKIYGGFI